MEAGSGYSVLTSARSPSAGTGQAVSRLVPPALASLLAGAIAATVQVIDPFDHGVWLVAYLLLVGSLAPLSFGLSEAAVLEHPPPAHLAAAQAALWGVGTVAVPFGVLAGTRLAVLIGSAALMLSLGSMALVLHDDADVSRPRALAGYAGLLLFMACSVCIGLALAWDLPWL